MQLIDVDVPAAPAALKGNQVSGLAVSGSFPVPTLVDLARATPIRLISLPSANIAKVIAGDDSTAAEVIPKGTYPGIDADVTTLVRSRRRLHHRAHARRPPPMPSPRRSGRSMPPWCSTTRPGRRSPPPRFPTLRVRLHTGALRYYDEAGITVPKTLR